MTDRPKGNTNTPDTARRRVMNNLYDTNSWSGHRGEQTLRRARNRNRAERASTKCQARPPGRGIRRALAKGRFGLRSLLVGGWSRTWAGGHCEIVSGKAELNVGTPPLLSARSKDPPTVIHSASLAGISASVAEIQGKEQHLGRTVRLIAWATALLATFLVLTLLPMPAFAQGDPSGAYKSGVPIEVPAYHGLEPDLGLSYNSSSRNGPLGVGWGISAISEIRRTSP